MSDCCRKPDCCFNEELPPPVALEYTPKGHWKHVSNFDTYVTGPTHSAKALIFIYDIFGPTSQCIQGADRLAEHLNIMVFMPDWFEGTAPSHDEYVRNPEAVKASLGTFVATTANISKNTQAVLGFAKGAAQTYSSITSMGVFGLCWGGKVAVLAGNADGSTLKASGQAHPGRLNVDDAKAITIPHICLASKDEAADIVSGYADVLKEKSLGVVETYATMFHGWMGARANLEDDDNRAEYERGYASAAQFFANHL